MNRVEWMNGICLIWSRGRLISPSLPVGDDRYLNLSSQKRPTGRNLGGNRLVRRSGTTSRGTVVLVFYVRMRTLPGPEILLAIFQPNKVRPKNDQFRESCKGSPLCILAQIAHFEHPLEKLRSLS